MVTIRSAYDESRHRRQKKTQWGLSKTRQQDAAAADINNIMKKYENTGVLPLPRGEAFFADVSQMPDYRAALEHVRAADSDFMSLPADMRAKFNNDAAEFLDFVSDSENKDEMIEMGLMARELVPAGEAPEESVSREGKEGAEEA